MSWLREAISDEKGSADMAYVSIGGLILVMVGSIVFLCTMSAVSYGRCTQVVEVSKEQRAAIPCSYDPNPLGLAIAACLGAFGSPIGALALYMGQTRRREIPAPAAPPMIAADNVNINQPVQAAAPTRKGKR